MELWAKIVLSFIAYFVAYAVVASLVYTRRVSYKARAARKPFFEELDRQLDLGVIANLQDVVRIQRSMAEEAGAQRFGRTDIKIVLEAYLLNVSRSDKDVEQVRNKIELIKEFLNQEPLAMLPETEQAIAQRLTQDIQDGQQDEALRHLRELVSSIGARYQSLDEQLSRTRAWTMIGAVGGILAVIIAVVMWSLYL